MKYENESDHFISYSLVVTTSNEIEEVSNDFLSLIEYTEDEILWKDISHVFFYQLRFPKDIFQKLDQEGSAKCYLFTKSLEPRSVLISISIEEHVKKYSILEKPESRLENRLQTTENLLLDNYFGMGVFCAYDFTLLKANQAFFNLLNEPFNKKEDSLGLKINELSFLESLENGRDAWNRVLLSGQTYYGREINGLCGNVKSKYYDVTIIPVTKKEKIQYIIYMMDEVTDRVNIRKRSEEQASIIKQQNEQLEAIIENMSDALVTFDKEGNYLKVSDSVQKIESAQKGLKKVGDSYEQGIYFDQYGKKMPVENLPVCRILRGEKVKQQRVVVKAPDGVRHYNVSGSPIMDDEGNFLMGVACNWDVTEIINQQKMLQKQQEEMLQKERESIEALKKAMNMKDEFLSLVSHEFKTPITVITSAIQAMELLCKDELSYKAKGFLNKIKQNSNRQLKLVNNLLDIIRINAGHLKVNKKNLDIVALTGLLTESISVFAEQKGIRLEFSSTVESMIIGMDEGKYEKILLNLLSNAVKFTPEGKSVSVRVFQKKVNKKWKLGIEVQDQGVGIPTEKQELIFERFGQVDSSLTRQAEGSGIGLSLVKMLVEFLEGEISLKSTEGVGSTFIVYFPTEKVDEAPKEAGSAKTFDHRLIHATTIEFSDVY